MDITQKMDLIKSEPTEEILTEEELKNLLETNNHPIHYMGLEISGIPHIGHILVAGKKINDLVKAGVKTKIFLADWHTLANNKLNGDWNRILKGAEFYKMLFKIVCPDTEIILGSDLYSKNDEYWKYVMKFSTHTTISRATRTLIIEGRSETEKLHVSQYLYPIMQVADIIALNVDIPHAGMDQRKVHMLAKELFKSEKLKPIIPLHHHLIASLIKPPNLPSGSTIPPSAIDSVSKSVNLPSGSIKEEIVAEMKMSKSKPGSAISILANDTEIKKAINNAWCPEKTIDKNPVLELCRYLIIPSEGRLSIIRDKKFGGDVEYTTYKDLENDLEIGKLHPSDLKNGVYDTLSKMIGNIRKHFENEKGRELISVFTEVKI